MAPAGRRCAKTPDERAAAIILKYRAVPGKAMKHRGIMILPSERAARREPRGGGIPMEPKTIGRLICPMPEEEFR